MENNRYEEALAHIRALLHDREAPEVPAGLAGDPAMRTLHQELLALRRTLLEFSGGDFSRAVPLKGFAGGTLKALQAAMRHLTWQARRVAEGDFSQRVEFLGEFSIAFNTMVAQLEDNLLSLRRKEVELTRLTSTLSREVELRSAAMKALSRSEATFKHLAERDPLTEILNRRAFFETARERALAAAAAELPCSLALLDVDHFKLFNDTHGHQAGDEALKTLVKVAGEALRVSDIMGRFGGEEFVFFFPGAGMRPAVAACERIRRSIAERRIDWETGRLPLTVSMGVTEIPADWDAPRDDRLLQHVISTADKALYQAKDQGRNRIVSLTCEQPPELPALDDPSEIPPHSPS